MKALKALRSRKGESYILSCFILMALCAVMSVLMFFLLTASLAMSQRKSAEQILDQYVQNNGIWIHNEVKESDDKTVELQPDQYISYLVLQQSLTDAGGGVYYSYGADNNVRYMVSDISLRFIEEETAKIELTYSLHLPMTILGKTTWVEAPATARSRFNMKFDEDDDDISGDDNLYNGVHAADLLSNEYYDYYWYRN